MLAYRTRGTARRSEGTEKRHADAIRIRVPGLLLGLTSSCSKFVLFWSIGREHLWQQQHSLRL